jgi:catechol 2,3-dioxygenase-like lactoylglutathione lyase family enzyme
MPTKSTHHIGLRVADIERSTKFYTEALGARVRTPPVEYAPPQGKEIFQGPDDLGFTVSLISFDEGVVELFQFSGDYREGPPFDATRAGILHFAFEVDDVDATVAAIERAGGGRVWEEPTTIGDGTRVMYMTDPDGHVLELMDCPGERLIEIINEAIETGAPPPGSDIGR